MRSIELRCANCTSENLEIPGGANAPSRNDGARNSKGFAMAFRKRRDALRSILSGSSCVRPGSVYDATSIRIAEDLGFEVGMFGGSVASLAVLGDPDIALITLTELAEQMRRMARAAALPVLMDTHPAYANALH